MMVRLQLADRLMLMLLRADGKVISGYIEIMLGGAILSDLILRGRIDIAGQGESVKAAMLVLRSPRRVLGLFSVASWPTLDGRPAAQVRRDLQMVVDDAARPDPETAVLSCCYSPVAS